MISKRAPKFMKRLSLCAFLAFGSSSAFAGPDDTTNYLMNTPVNLMDLGVFRLTLLIRDKLGSGFAAYHWDSNEIRIFLFDLPNEEMNAEAVCIEAISEIRRAANVQDGTPFSGISGFATLFKHSGYVKGTVEKNNERLMDLDKKFKIFCITPEATFMADVVGVGYSVSRKGG
ncbi:hypothetical protein [Sulfitobacter sp. W074]|uniref:hypothetical protein n=1 Tax=Sulfitobacter sp. W074 TaxID=2867026 RepID=UPI0021A7E0A2|nr:hypothetical protein [Sulfitobacter sp. W074]UWR37662.1 hypothetical protein K3762_01045 [Sulfitobacter sp. W074]